MVKSKYSIKKTIKHLKKYIEAIEKKGIHIRKAYLFGSYADNSFNEWSDIDIALVSDDFEGIRFKDKNKIRKITLRINSDISPLPYKTDDFTQEDLFVKEIIETGIQIV